MAKYPILKRGRVADLKALIRHLATSQEQQRYSKVLDEKIPTLSSPSRQIVVEHPDLFRIGGEGSDVAVSLLFRFMLPGRPPLDENQIQALLEAVDNCHRQALEHTRYNLEWWKWITSFLSGGLIAELIRFLVMRLWQ